MRLIDLVKLKADDFVLLESNRHQSIITKVQAVTKTTIIINNKKYCNQTGYLKYGEYRYHELSINKLLKSRKQFIKAKRRVIITDPDVLLNRVLFYRG